MTRDDFFKSYSKGAKTIFLLCLFTIPVLLIEGWERIPQLVLIGSPPAPTMKQADPSSPLIEDTNRHSDLFADIPVGPGSSHHPRHREYVTLSRVAQLGYLPVVVLALALYFPIIQSVCRMYPNNRVGALLSLTMIVLCAITYFCRHYGIEEWGRLALLRLFY